MKLRCNSLFKKYFIFGLLKLDKFYLFFLKLIFSTFIVKFVNFNKPKYLTKDSSWIIKIV